MSNKDVSRRGFVAAAVAFVGGASYVQAQGMSQNDYDTTLGAMLSNKLLAELEPIAMYDVGQTSPKGYFYRGLDECGQPVTHLDSNLAVEISFIERKNGFDVCAKYIPCVGDIKYRAFRPFKLRYRAEPKHVVVTAWNDCGGCLDSFRKEKIINAFVYNTRSRRLSACMKNLAETKVVPTPEPNASYPPYNINDYINENIPELSNDIGPG